MRRLAVRPRPVPEESLPGYAIRLARRNGWPSAQALLRAAGTCGQPHQPAHADRVLATLEQLTGHGELRRHKAFLPGADLAFRHDEHRVIRNLALDKVRVCPVCLEAAPVLKASWQYLPFTHCTEHRQELLSRCPRCTGRLQWNAALLGCGCPECGVPWRAMRQGDSNCPPCQAHLLNLGSSEQRHAFLRDLSVACLRALRPYDGLLDVTERPPRVENWSSVLATAYALLNDAPFAARWVRSCSTQRFRASALGSAALTAPVTSMTDRLEGRWPIARITRDRSTAEGAEVLPAAGLSRRRARTAHLDASELDEALRYQTDLHGVARAIGCEASTVAGLADAGVLWPLNHARLSRDAIFDLRELAEQLSLLPPRGDTDARTLRGYRRLFPVFGAMEADVLAAALQGSLAAQLSVAGHQVVDRLVVQPRAMLRFLQRSLRAKALSPDMTLSAREVQAMLRLPRRDLSMLATGGVLVPARWQRADDRFFASDVVSVIERYWVLPRHAYLKRMSRSELASRLVRQGLRPAIGRFLYHRSAALSAAVRNRNARTLSDDARLACSGV